MQQYSVEQIKAAFFKDDLQYWSPPELAQVDWQDLDFLAWPHPRAGNYFVCIEGPQGLVGCVFEMNSGNGRPSVSCQLCHASNQTVGGKAAMVATASNPRRKIGFHVCSDLACSQRIRGQKPALFQYETISIGRRIERIQEKLVRFSKQVQDRG